MLSVVLPCYNEEANAENVLNSTIHWLESKKEPWEIIAVNDGSTDRTGEILEKFKKLYPVLHVVTHEKNLGYGLAVRAGLDAAAGNSIGFMDSDGQFKPEEFDLLLPFLKDYPLVTGRRARRSDPLFRRLFGKLLGAMNYLVLGLWVKDINCGLKILRRETWPEVRPVHGVEKLFNTEIFLNLKKKKIPWHQVNVKHYARIGGRQTGGSIRVIFRMFRELRDLKSTQKKLFS